MQGICAHPVIVHPDAERLAEGVAERWVALCRDVQAQRDCFHVALSGGSTPRRLYRLLAEAGYRTRIDWSRVCLYFGDERAVPPTHADSNFRMARESLLAHIDIPADNVLPMQADPERIHGDAAAYAELLRARLPGDANGTPVFDLILLGMGADGHTCSLFPDTPILQERRQPVAAVHVAHLNSWRLSLTYPVLDAARQLLFMVAGGDKAAMLRRICREPTGQTPVPVQGIRPRGAVEWHLDRTAAAELDA
ncbi:MAG: 6-phosphogluconolactonase [Gammaproteobacteria bacterium]